MKRILKWLAIGLGTFVLLLAAVGLWQREAIAHLAKNWDAISDGAEAAAALKKPDDVLDFIAANPDRVSLAIWTVGDEARGFFHQADVQRPLASTVKILVLAAYAEQVDEGTLDPEAPVRLEDWEAYWLPGTDGGAHEAALEELRGTDRLADGQVRLHDVARAMIRFSDNAATDLLLERIGREPMEAFVAKLGLPGQEPPFPLSGAFLTWMSSRDEAPAAERLERYRSMERQAYVDEAWKRAQALRSDAELRQAERRRLEEEGIGLTIREQAAFAAALGNRGTARGYAQLMEQVAAGTLRGHSILREHLQWPMEDESVHAGFDVLGTKGGSLPGIMTSASYADPDGDRPLQVMALFFADLPGAVWLRMVNTFVHQQFELRLFHDEAFVERVRERLGGTEVAHEG